MILALFAGIGDLFLALTLKKPKENQCFWLRTLKNLRKINVFALPEHLVTLKNKKSIFQEKKSPCGRSTRPKGTLKNQKSIFPEKKAPAGVALGQKGL